MEDKFENIKSYINDVMSDKTNNTLGDWISDYGGVVNENYTITFGSHFALQKMLDRRDKEVIRIALSHAINSNDELVAEVERLTEFCESFSKFCEDVSGFMNHPNDENSYWKSYQDYKKTKGL